MLLVEVIILVAAVVIATRTRPPERRTAPRTLSLLAGIAIVAFGIAMGAIVIVNSARVFMAALLVAGLTAALFLWLVRAPEEEDGDDGDDTPDEEPPADSGGDARRFRRKRTGPVRPREPRR
jgi:high-affinity Fe2+/Pb2+ permease